MDDRIKYIESSQIKKDVPEFKVGDTVRVYSKIQEEGKTRLQAFEGTVIRIKGSGLRMAVTVRRISYGEGVEKAFPLHSPSVDSIKVVRKGKVRRAKLYYLRRKIGKKSKVEGEDIYHTMPEASSSEASPQETQEEDIQQ
jgi:large subunit ribosomal protein L19